MPRSHKWTCAQKLVAFRPVRHGSWKMSGLRDSYIMSCQKIWVSKSIALMIAGQSCSYSIYTKKNMLLYKHGHQPITGVSYINRSVRYVAKLWPWTSYYYLIEISVPLKHSPQLWKWMSSNLKEVSSYSSWTMVMIIMYFGVFSIIFRHTQISDCWLYVPLPKYQTARCMSHLRISHQWNSQHISIFPSILLVKHG